MANCKLWWYNMGLKKKYVLLILCALTLVSISFASAQVNISVVECSTCHDDITFNASPVVRGDTCVNCHASSLFASNHKEENFAYTEYGWFRTNSSMNASAPDIHDTMHKDKYVNCDSCHVTSECTKCHNQDDVFHATHGSNTASYSCGSESCHNLYTFQYGSYTNIDAWVITPSPACENCHNDVVSVSRHDIAGVHQSDLTPECQTCHSDYLPDTHADIANLSYSGDSCAVCHQSMDSAVISAITNNDTSCASCHTLHGDITDIHTLNTTTSTLKCPDCHQNTYLPELHNNFSVINNLPTNCSVCHSNANITISSATAECTTCHDSQLDEPHLNANHTSVAECIICHDADLSIEHFDNCSVCHTNPTKVDIDSATNDCASCHVDQNVGFHTNMSAKHTRTSTCINCHKDSYLPDLHNDFALANEMTNCTICHDNTKVNTDNATSDCITCHGQQLPTQHANEVAKHTTDACAECHGSVYGSYLPDTHNATEENGRCDLCHSNVAINMSISTSNCTSCHGPQVNEPHYNALEKHKFESPVECLVCHDRYIPTAHTDQYGNTNCLICHGNNPAITYLPTDKNCSSCHGAQLPAEHGDLTVVHTAAASPGCVRCHNTKNVSTIHNNVCSTCHGSILISILPSTVECNECHGANALLPAHSSRGNPKR